MFKTKSSVYLYSILIFFFGLSGCREVISQDPKDSFKSGKFPQMLQDIANQKHEFSVSVMDRIRERVKKDKVNFNTFKVGVIDSGIDLVHPDLIDQLSFELDSNGKVVKVGADVMGSDAFPSYVMVNPELFAFGAKGVEGELIVEPLGSPLGFIKQINDAFLKKLLEQIEANPKLNSSLFNRINNQNITVLGAYYAFEDYKKELVLDAYKERVQQNKPGYNAGKVLTDQQLKNDGFSTQAKYETFIKELNFDFNSSQNLPNAIWMFASRFEHFGEFYQVLGRVLAEIETEFKLKNNIRTFEKFADSKVSASLRSRGLRSSVIKDQQRDSLLAAAAFVLKGYKNFDPVVELKSVLAKITGKPDLGIRESIDLYNLEMQSRFDALKGRQDLSQEAQEALRDFEKNFSRQKGILNELAKIEDNTKEAKQLNFFLRQRAVRVNHPYIMSGETVSNSHGTHVAATVARQNPDIRIYPIKVVTQSISANQKAKKLKETNLTEMQLWLTRPEIQILLKQVLTEYGISRMTDAAVLKEIDTYLKGNSLNLIFMDEIYKAIKESGDRKLKLVNVSLGTVFEKNFKISAEQRKQGVATDLFAEFARWKMGATIRESAPETLFLVASGNDGGWIDGVSRTAFPVGITSRRLDLISKANPALPGAPNNLVRNVIAVGSINPNQSTMTQFSNLIIDDKIPQIFSTGEEVQAAVPGRTTSFTSEVEAITDRIKSISYFPEDGKDGVAYDDSTKSQLNDLAQAINIQDGVTQLAKPILLGIFNSKYPVTRARMSGTSMATPTATGLIADFLIKKAQSLGVRPNDVYNHPEFSPAKIIEDVLRLSKSKSVSRNFTIQTLIEGIKTWEVQDQVRKGQKEIKGLAKAPAKTCISVFN
jgi:subtilisin family serine protease